MAALQLVPTRPMIGRYEVVEKLGEGGMAETWLCRMNGTRGFSRRVVVKILKNEHLDQPEFHTMFTDEARVGAALEHPAIPRVEELGEHGGVPFMVQEYVEGPSLYQVLKVQRRNGHMDHRLAARIVGDIARALDHAFTATDGEGRSLKVVHRDVSPSNILISSKGQAKLIDFGVARFADRETKTEAGVLKGKLRYMAPEAVLHGKVSHQSDLYALGVVLYVLLVGRHAWSGPQELGDRLKGVFPKPSELADDVPLELERIALRCLASEPSARYATGKELASELDTWLEESGGPVSDLTLSAQISALFPGGPDDWKTGHAIDPSRSFGTPPPPPTDKPDRWMPAMVGAIALGVVSIVALIGVLLWTSRPTPAVVVPPSVVVDVAAERRDAAATLLDAAERALQAGDEAEATSQLRAAAGLELVDPLLLSRRERLQAELQVTTRLRAAERTLALDPEAGLNQALALDGEYPGRPAVTALVDRAQAAVTAKAEAAGEPVPAAATAKPAPVAPAPVAKVPEAAPAPAPAGSGLLNPAFGEAKSPGLLDPFGAAPKPGTEATLKDPYGKGGP